MSAFSDGFNHGFFHGMFNRMFGGFGMFNWGCWNSAPMFFTPNYSFGNFSPYQTPIISMPSIYSYNVPNFTNINTPSWQGFDCSANYSVPDFSSNFTWGDTFVKSSKPDKKVKEDVIVTQSDGDFDKMLEFVLSVEGGYTDNDCGAACNKGIRQPTYDSYRTKKGLSKRPVKQITDEEVKDLYYTMFYQASGADKIKDARMALYVFDTAVNMGVGAAKELYKESDGDLDKFENLRIARYERIAAKNNGAKQKYLKGWKNRVAKVESYAEKQFVA